jgi:hypothetical protein
VALNCGNNRVIETFCYGKDSFTGGDFMFDIGTAMFVLALIALVIKITEVANKKH